MFKIKHIKYIFGTVLLSLLFYIADVRKLALSIASMRFVDLFLIILITFPLIHSSVLKWHLFLKSFGIIESKLKLWRLYCIGYYVNSFLPSQFGGDITRSIAVGKSSGHANAASATFLERYFGFGVMLTISFFFSCFDSSLTFDLRLASLVLLPAFVLASLFLLSKWVQDMLGLLPISKNIRVKAIQCQDNLIKVSKDPVLVLHGIALSLVFHLSAVVNTIVVAHGVGWVSPNYLQLFVIVPLVMTLSAIPLTPGGIGVTEGAFFLLLQKAGASPSQALAVGVVLRAKVFALALAGGLLVLFTGKKILRKR